MRLSCIGCMRWRVSFLEERSIREACWQAYRSVLPDPDTRERRPPAHQREEILRLRTTASGGSEDVKAMHKSGNAVIKTPTLGFDTRKSHNGDKYNTTFNKKVIIFLNHFIF